MNHIRLYNIFRKEMHLSDASAEEAVNAMQELTGFAFDSKMNLLATKGDISLLKGDISLLQGDISLLKEDMSSLKNEINSLKKDMHANKDDLYRAIYLSGFLQFVAMVGTVLTVIKFIK
ncbi:MAG: hypothetical protein M3N30_01790 [Bacteroidota bacterium]|nr:hypothetical protein [Bacteroidota bacterium]